MTFQWEPYKYVETQKNTLFMICHSNKDIQRWTTNKLKGWGFWSGWGDPETSICVHFRMVGAMEKELLVMKGAAIISFPSSAGTSISQAHLEIENTGSP